jgi:hypothetical protein
MLLIKVLGLQSSDDSSTLGGMTALRMRGAPYDDRGVLIFPFDANVQY